MKKIFEDKEMFRGMMKDFVEISNKLTLFEIMWGIPLKINIDDEELEKKKRWLGRGLGLGEVDELFDKS